MECLKMRVVYAAVELSTHYNCDSCKKVRRVLTTSEERGILAVCMR